MDRKKYKSILVISDSHYPYEHTDMLDFLKAMKRKYKPDKIVHIGDEIDGHSISFHPKDPNLLSPSDEFCWAVTKLEDLYKLFPDVNIIDSNHGSLVYRKGTYHGLPRTVFKSYRDILEAPKGWIWSHDLTLRMSDGMTVYFHHGKTATIGKLSKNMSMSTVQGHYHSKFGVNYWANPLGLYWDMRVGCLIDDKSLAFNYNKTTVDRPIIGTGIIVDGHPRTMPMILDKHGRWTGDLL